MGNVKERKKILEKLIWKLFLSASIFEPVARKKINKLRNKVKNEMFINPIKAGGSESMYSLGGRPTPPPLP